MSIDFLIELYGKFYFHFVHSFNDKENITPKEAHKMAVEFAEHWKGFEVVIATHIDTDNAHSHFIINYLTSDILSPQTRMEEIRRIKNGENIEM